MAHLTYPVVIVKVKGIKCQALLDTGVGSCYASAMLLNDFQVVSERKKSER